MKNHNRRAFVTALLVLCSILVAITSALASHQTVTLPARLSDAEFWKFIEDASEPNGTFSSSNFVSNETMFQHAIPTLVQRTKPGHVYLGVGPEQNFTYIAALRPGMAIIFDIRRGNLHLQMLYKALFELSANRAQFVSRLFSRPLPATISTTVTADSIFSMAVHVTADSALHRKNFEEVSNLLLTRHGFALSPPDMIGIRRVYDAFFRGGPRMGYFSTTRPPFPTYMDLMTQNDGQTQRSYLANEASFRMLKDMHQRNMIVPVVGDFAGPKAIRTVGAWLKGRKATVQAFYVSNVEQYLFQSQVAWKFFYENVATLPLDASSMFIRSNTVGDQNQVVYRPNLACSIQEQIAAYNSGQLTAHAHAVLQCR